MRFRSIALTLSRALFGLDLMLPEFPTLKSVCGLGISDSDIYANRLARIFSYTNTFYHQEPFLDLTVPPQADLGKYDFIICSEVLEHVPEPIERAFQTLCKLLKPTGVLILTVPYAIDEENAEHYSGLEESSLAEVGGQTVLVGRLPSGEYRVFDKLVFHGGPGSTLEHRLFSEAALRQHLASAGFPIVQVDASGSRKFGVTFPNPWSLPIVAKRAPFALSAHGVTELMEQLAIQRAALKTSRWLRLGRALGLGPKLRELPAKS
jgi:SAM-dependent methyltransferase